MNGGIIIRKRRKRKFILYELLLLTGIASCVYGLFLLFLLFNKTNFLYQTENEFVRLYGYVQNIFLKGDNLYASKESINHESNLDLASKTTSQRNIDDQTFLSSDKKLSPLYMKNIDSNYIELMSIHSALQNYKEEKHYYPKSLQALTLEYPNNYLSVIPERMHYTLIGDHYSLSYNGHQISSNQKEKIELHFYPATNHLVISFANLPLASYPIASGKDPLPFKNSKIELRVINPNGGTGPFGTRGLVLQDHYAIHGTNNPSSIGQYITLGCIRLFNENIETLFSFIPIGTPLRVKNGNAPSPIFSHGLSDFTGSNISKDKTSPEEGTTNTMNLDSKASESFDKISSSPNNTICECNLNKIFYWRG